jgi:hypothetical protein
MPSKTPSKKTTAKMGAKGAVAMARHPTLRRATTKAATPPAKVGWRVGKVVVKRKARAQAQRVGAQAQRVGATGRDVTLFAAIYGPMAAEVFGFVEPPKPRRRAPAFAAGAVIGAGALYALTRRNRD